MTKRRIIYVSAYVLFFFLFWGSAAQFAVAKEDEADEHENIPNREAWFNHTRTQGLKGRNAASLIYEARQKAKAMIRMQGSILHQLFTAAPANVSGNWTAMGPQPISQGSYNWSGRGSAIAVDLTNDNSGNLLYYGAASGGVWKSTNAMSASPTFVPISDQTESLAVGAIALDSSNGQSIIYVGTGEANGGLNDTYYGIGVLKSTDGGKTWAPPVTSATGPNGTVSFFGLSFSKILVNATPNMIVAGTTAGGFSDAIKAGSLQPLNLSPGVFYSTDGGNSWTQSPTLAGATVNDIVYDSRHGNYLASVYGGGFYSSPDGITWKFASWPFQTLPANPPAFFSRANLAVRSGVIYALVEMGGELAAVSSQDTGIYQSTDGGNSWTAISAPPQSLGGQLNYDLCLLAPSETNELVIGGVLLFDTNNVNGMNTSWTPNTLTHYDCHALANVGPNQWFLAQDGGLYFTPNSGGTWGDLNSTLNTVQFYSVSPDTLISGQCVGGSQDNGSVVSTPGSLIWVDSFGGDGFYTLADPQKGGVYYGESTAGDIERYNSNAHLETTVLNSIQLGSPPMEMVPQAPGTILAGSNYVLAGPENPSSAGTGWITIGGPFADGSAVQFFAPAPNDSNTVYLTEGNYVQKTTNAFSASPTWTPFNPTGLSLQLGHIAAGSSNPQTVYVIVEGFNDGQKIYESPNGGTNWINISGNLPNVPLNWITIDPQNQNNIYVASDVGVFLASDGGVQNEQWQNVGTGLPDAPILQVKISNTFPRQLVAATFGRGAWTLGIAGNTIPTATATMTVTATPTSVIACPGGSSVGPVLNLNVNNPVANLSKTQTYAVRAEFNQNTVVKAIQVYGMGTGLERKIGVYDDAGNGSGPSTLLASATFVDGSAGSVQEITLNLEVGSGFKWLALSSAVGTGNFNYYNSPSETSEQAQFAGQMPLTAANPALSFIHPVAIAALYCPVCTPSGRQWSQTTSSYIGGPREFMGTTIYNGLMWTLGGRSPLGDSGDCDFSSDGINWSSATPFGPMEGREGQVLLTFDPGDGRGERLFAIGGSRYPGNTFTGSPTNTFNDVWSSFDGANWTQLTGNGRFPAGAPYVGAVFNNKMWLIGGALNTPAVNGVWSSADGATWTFVNYVEGGDLVQGAVVYNGQLMIIENGDRARPIFGNTEMATKDGNLWERVGGPQPPRQAFGNRSGFSFLSAWGKLWVIGGNLLGQTANQDSLMNDIWNSTDGVVWISVTGNAGFPIRQNAGSYNYSGQLWVLGGMTNPANTPSNGFGYTGDVWSTYCIEGPVTVRGGVSGSLLGSIVNQLGHLMGLSFNLSNTGADPLSLSQVEVRYWFNSNCGTPDIRAWVQGRAGDTGRRDNNNGGLIQTSLGSLTPGSSIQYISFKFNNGNLPVGNQITIGAFAIFAQNALANCSLSAVPNGNQLTIYENGTLVQGQEPTGSPATPTLSPTYTPTISPTQSPTSSPTAILTKTVTPSPTVPFVATPTPTCPFGTNIAFVPCGPTSTPTTQMVLAALVVSHPSTSTPTLTPMQTAASTEGSGLVLSAVMVPHSIHGGKPVKLLLTLAGPASVQWTITSSAGEKIYQTTILGQAGLNTLTWSGLNQAGLPVGDGVYTYVIQAQEGLNQNVTQGRIFVRR